MNLEGPAVKSEPLIILQLSARCCLERISNKEKRSKARFQAAVCLKENSHTGSRTLIRWKWLFVVSLQRGCRSPLRDCYLFSQLIWSQQSVRFNRSLMADNTAALCTRVSEDMRRFVCVWTWCEESQWMLSSTAAAVCVCVCVCVCANCLVWFCVYMCCVKITNDSTLTVTRCSQVKTNDSVQHL